VGSFIYIVTWTLATFTSAPCPSIPVQNEYGVKTYISCAVLHGRYEYEKMVREFLTRDSAIAFIDGGKAPAGYFGSMSETQDFKLDSISK